jgi:hypothetical protein
MKSILNIAVVVAASIAVALLTDAWRTARHDSQQLAATLAAQNTVIQQADDREKQRNLELTSALASIHAQTRAVRTPQQAAKQLASALPLLPLPVTINSPSLSTPLPPDEIPSTTIAIPQPDLVPLYDHLQDCRASAIQNETLTNNLADEKKRSEALLRERDAANAVAHGGTILTRLKRAAKWFAIGVAAGAAISAIVHR